MDFRLLGSLEACEEGRAIVVGGGKQRSLLALLLVHANRPVSEDMLIEALWGENATPKTRSNLHVLVSRLRRALGDDRIVREGAGYAVRVSDGELDVQEFEQLRAAGRTAEALSLWRGSALADFTYEGWAASEIARLEELRLLAVEERIETDLEAGRHSELVGELQALVREHPLREEFRRQLIVALYRSGRQAEALEAYRATRRVLDEELGLEPGRALKDLERAVLRQDPELDARPVSGPALLDRGRVRVRGLAALGAAALAFGGVAAAAVIHGRGDGHGAVVTGVAEQASSAVAAPVGRADAAAVPTTRVVVVRERTRMVTQASSGGGPSSTPTPAPRPPIPADVPPPASAQETTTSSRPRPAPRARPRSVPRSRPRAAPQPAVAPVRITDDFEDGLINRTIWHQSVAGTGVEVAERNGRLEVEFAPSAEGGGEYDAIDGHYGTTCRFLGDFDVRVDYELLEWPSANGVAVQLTSWYSGDGANVGRQSTQSEEYVATFPRAWNSIPTTDNAGTLRLTRTGSHTIARYRSGSRWLSVMIGRPTGSPMIGLQAWSDDTRFAHQRIRIAFDNFRMVADQPVC